METTAEKQQLQRHQQLILTSVWHWTPTKQRHHKLIINGNKACPSCCLTNEAKNAQKMICKSFFLCAAMQKPFTYMLPAEAQREKLSRPGQRARRANWIEPTLRCDSSSKCHGLNQQRGTPQPLTLLILTSISVHLVALQILSENKSNLCHKITHL